MTEPPASVGVCIPTLNPGRWIDRMLDALRRQRGIDALLVIDSASDDGTVARFADVGAEIVTIRRDDFDHGGTRNEGVRRLGTDVVVFLTQDAVPATEDAIATLVETLLADPKRAIAFGRQLPSPGAGALARAHRAFNYGEDAFERTAADIERLGVRAAFNSNSFAAYRASALDAVGGFPCPVVGSEDRCVAAQVLRAGWSVAYEPLAQVEHSHDYSRKQDFRRYFDIGVFHATERWFDDLVGPPQSEGRKLVRAQIESLRSSGARFACAKVVSHAAASWAGFQAGRHHARLPRRLSARWTTAPAYFTRTSGTDHSAQRKNAAP